MISIISGQLCQSAGVMSDIGTGPMVEGEWYLRFQVFLENGEPSKANYCGPGTVVKNGGTVSVILGDTESPFSFLIEYLVSKEPTQESLDAFLAFEAGFKRGADARRRLPKQHTNEFAEGFMAGRAARKANP